MFKTRPTIQRTPAASPRYKIVELLKAAKAGEERARLALQHAVPEAANER